MTAEAGTWADLIRHSLIEISVISPKEEVDEDDEATSFKRLQEMLALLGVESLIKPGLSDFPSDGPFCVTTSAMGYTIGPAAEMEADNPDIVTAKQPEEIYAVNYKHQGELQARPLDPTSYSVIAEERISYGFHPSKYYYNKAHPISTILFDRQTLPGDEFTIVARGHFADIEADGQTSDILPEGYWEPIMQNLAIKLAPSFGVEDYPHRTSQGSQEGDEQDQAPQPVSS